MALFGGNKKQDNDKQIIELDLDQIIPSQFQPRKKFTKKSIEELAQTLDEHGLLQPIVVREMDDDEYEIIAGERRFRAADLLGWETIPAIVEEMGDEQTASLALIENLQRENLNPIDEAKAYVELMELNDQSQTDLAQSVGKTQSYLANKIRLLKLGQEAQDALIARKITQRHGRELLKLDEDDQEIVLQDILEKGLNVTETEAEVERVLNGEDPSGEEEKPAKKARQKVSTKSIGRNNSFKVPVNTIKKTIDMIEQSGTKVEYEEQYDDDSYQIVINLLKDED